MPLEPQRARVGSLPQLIAQRNWTPSRKRSRNGSVRLSMSNWLMSNRELEENHMRHTVLLAAALVGLASAALANPYATAITPVGDGASFILNEDADSVELILDGGAGGIYALPTTAGAHTFSLLGDFGVTGDHSFAIRATKSAAAGWTQFIPDDTPRSFWSPVGVSINKDMSGPNFGRVYVSNAVTGTTGFGRPTTSGIYMLNADGSEAGFADGGIDWAAQGNLAPFKSTIGPDGHLYVADYSNDLAFEFSADMSVATQLIDASNKTDGQYVESIHVEGTQADGNRKVYLVDSHYADARRGLIEYDLGANPTATTDDIGTQYIGPDYFDFYPRDVARDSNGDWYMNQYRYSPGQAPPLTKFDGSGTIPLGDDPAEVLWEADMAYTGAYGIDICEEAGLIAYGHYYTGEVNIFDLETGAYIATIQAGSRIRELAFDAAGNLVTVDNSTEWARFWSPGGDSEFTTDGWFLIPEPTSLALLAIGGLLLRRRR